MVEARAIHQRHERLGDRLGDRDADASPRPRRARPPSSAAPHAVAQRDDLGAGSEREPGERQGRAAPPVRSVLAVVAVDARRVHPVRPPRCGPSRRRPRARSRARACRGPSTPRRAAASQVELLRVEPEPLVEPRPPRSNAARRTSIAAPLTQSTSRSDEPVPPGLLVRAGERVRGRERAEERVADRLPDRREPRGRSRTSSRRRCAPPGRAPRRPGAPAPPSTNAARSPAQTSASGLRNKIHGASVSAAPWFHAADRPRFVGFIVRRICGLPAFAVARALPSCEALSITRTSSSSPPGVREQRGHARG